MRQMERRRASKCCFNYQVLCSKSFTDNYEFPIVGYMPLPCTFGATSVLLRGTMVLSDSNQKP